MRMEIAAWRKSQGLSQGELAERLGLKSRAQVADFERGRQRLSAELAIKMDRISRGVVQVADLRPDLHDVRVIRPEAESRASA